MRCPKTTNRLVSATAVLLLSAVAFAQETGAVLSAVAQPVVPEQVSASGRVVALKSARIGPRVAGILAAMGEDETGKPLDAGMKVKKGQVLFSLEKTTMSNAVAAAEAALAMAKANLANLKAPPRPERVTQLESAVADLAARLADKRREEERYKRLVEVEKTLPLRRLEEVQTDVMSLTAQKEAAESRLLEAKNGPTATEIAVAEAQVAQASASLKAAQDDLRDATVSAAFDGVITARLRSVGDYVAGGGEVLSLVSTEPLEVELRLPETYLPSVQEGATTATIRSALLKEEVRLPVARVVDAVDAGKGIFTVRLTLPAEKKGQLVPGSFVTASVQLSGDRRGYIVPQRAVREEGGKSYVLVAEGGKLKRQEVQLGERLTETIVISSGLADGVRVYFGSADKVKEGTIVNQDAAL